MAHTPYRCSLKYVWEGLKDTWAEKVSGAPSSDSTSSEFTKTSFAATLLTLFLAFTAVALALGAFMPTFAASGYAPTPATMFAGAHALFILAVMGSLAYVVRKFARFAKRMCVRGWELETGLRKPAYQAKPSR